MTAACYGGDGSAGHGAELQRLLRYDPELRSAEQVKYLGRMLTHVRFACSCYTVGNIAIIAKISQNVNFCLVISKQRRERRERGALRPRSLLLTCQIISSTNANEYLLQIVDRGGYSFALEMNKGSIESQQAIQSTEAIGRSSDGHYRL